MPSLRLIIASGQIPFVKTANDHLAEALVAGCRYLGHRATRLRLPLPARIEDLPGHLSAFRLLDLETCDGAPSDRLIALDLPSACLRHRRKTLWIGLPLAGLSPAGDAGALPPETADSLRSAAGLFAVESQNRFAVSVQAAGDLEEFAEVAARVLPAEGFDQPVEHRRSAIEQLLGLSCES